MFTQEQKCAIFDKIAENYFQRNFGSMSKSDFETLLFSEYIENRIANQLPFDDYSLSKELGITQSRIRSLKEKKELKYPYAEFNWKNSFVEAVKNAKLDKTDHYIKIIVQDVNVMNEVRNYIEQKGWYDECSLNKKLLRIPMDCFTEILFEDESFTSAFSEEAKAQIRHELGEENHSVREFLKDFSKEGLKEFLMAASSDIIPKVLRILPVGGISKIGFNYLADLIEKM